MKTNYLLFKNNGMNYELYKKNNNKDKELFMETNLNYRISKAKTIFFKRIRNKDKSKDNLIKEIKEREKRNYNYFYIFNYNKEEIAAY